jgi:putative endonuclease
MFKLGSETGRIGEDTACMFLMKHGFTIVDRNYWKKWGEIDIVALKEGKTHFIEVKSVTRPNLENVAHETEFKPEDNVHLGKQKRLSRVITTYISEKGIKEGEWQLDIASVYLDIAKKQAKIRILENIILDVL